ncbi:hypothetical protein BD779DRAFT_1529663 [Infundibulicybe gibba]|nr:hypothetical protein BD779DRAFT_1586133 [Infundibulicybe gibba]KAF8886787.1 hypothetical protein BD779DRAFT_1529663 [Infundibulicybe gibba]
MTRGGSPQSRNPSLASRPDSSLSLLIPFTREDPDHTRALKTSYMSSHPLLAAVTVNAPTAPLHQSQHPTPARSTSISRRSYHTLNAGIPACPSPSE